MIPKKNIKTAKNKKNVKLFYNYGRRRRQQQQ